MPKSTVSSLAWSVIFTSRMLSLEPEKFEQYREEIAVTLAKFPAAKASDVGARPCRGPFHPEPCLRWLYLNSVDTVRRVIRQIDGSIRRLELVFDPSSELYKAIEVIYVLDRVLQGESDKLEMNDVTYSECPCWIAYRSGTRAAKPSDTGRPSLS